MNAFEAALIRFVRRMPEAALLELVKGRLGAAHVGVQAPASSKARLAGPASAERQGLMDRVERIVKVSSGLSVSEIARLACIPLPRAAAVLKKLKQTKRVFQGGDRRFARYAGDPTTAEHASQTARQTATGPIVAGPKSDARRNRRHAQPAAPAA